MFKTGQQELRDALGIFTKAKARLEQATKSLLREIETNELEAAQLAAEKEELAQSLNRGMRVLDRFNELLGE